MVSRLITLGKEAGVKGLFAGLGPRMSMSTPSLSSLLTSYTFWDSADAAVMTAGLVSSQFLCVW